MNQHRPFKVSNEQSLNEPKDSKQNDLQMTTKQHSAAPAKPTWESFFKSKNFASEDFMSERDLKLEKD